MCCAVGGGSKGGASGYGQEKRDFLPAKPAVRCIVRLFRSERLLNVKSFPEGDGNCYALVPEQGKGNKYLIRASFVYCISSKLTKKSDVYSFGINVPVELITGQPAILKDNATMVTST
ncbi:hypothetical protein C3L33_14677, partial [Rhododendron williamsianum]